MHEFKVGDKVRFKEGLTHDYLEELCNLGARVGWADHMSVMDLTAEYTIEATNADSDSVMVTVCNARTYLDTAWLVPATTDNPFKLPFGYVCKSDVFRGNVIRFLGYYQNLDGSVYPVYGMVDPDTSRSHHYDIEDVHNEEVV